MKKTTMIILGIIIFIAIMLFFVKLTGYIVSGTAVNTCYDTDSGENYWEKGSVSGENYLFTKEIFDEEDYCKNEKILIEYYCREKNIHSYKEETEFYCEQGCSKGKCLGEEVENPVQFSIWKRLIDFLKDI